MTTRRAFLTGLTATFVGAPAIVRASSLMPVKAWSDLMMTPHETLGFGIINVHPRSLGVPGDPLLGPGLYWAGEPIEQYASIAIRRDLHGGLPVAYNSGPYVAHGFAITPSLRERDVPRPRRQGTAASMDSCISPT